MHSLIKIKKRCRPTVFLGALWLLLAASAGAEEQLAPSVELRVSDAYVYVPIAGRNITAGYFTLSNQSEKDYQLVGAESAAVGRIELHSHQHEDGVMKMRREERVTLAAGSQLVFAPGGLHLMLFDLAQGLQSGQQLDLTLIFDDGTRLPLEAQVKSRFDRPHH
jgi:copper(I)-binding protein